ncbi:copper resistance protein NlpE N-terminal domain-containing protein [Azohydromonas sediminis]|uniref:copper resistance protein NlpE N-terminal domain-containing protein n=1 Tax=Azohydromonas sediminis TaxID=2259674 RepID=UPI0013C2A1E2|nr:copper resistance protein NlpE N-terminal domain-containing protein [Azohydromonas sediminis]
MTWSTFECWRRGAVVLAAVVIAWSTTAGIARATSQGPVADGPYVGTLPCADCAGIRTTLTLYTMGEGGAPLVYRMTSTYLGTRDGDRTEERLGPWARVGSGADAVVRLEPSHDAIRQSWRRADRDTLVLLDRDEKPIATAMDLRLRRDATATAARLEPPRTLWRGTLRRQADRLLFTPCGGGQPMRLRDVSPEVVVTAAITDLGFDRRGSVYLEAYGTLRQGELTVDRLNRAGVEMGCPKEAIGFRAFGHEPSWSLVSNRSVLRFVEPGGATLSAPPLPLSWRWPGGRPDRAEASLASSTESSALNVVLTPKICRDTMADAVYGFTAQVGVARPEPARTLAGCAFLGTEGLP